MPEPTIPVYVRLSPVVYHELVSLAQAEKTSVTEYCRAVLTAAAKYERREVHEGTTDAF